MQNPVLASFGLVILGSLALSCSSGSGNSDGAGGKAVDTGTAGAPSGTGGANSVATAGSNATGTAGSNTTGTAGDGSVATAGSNATGTAGDGPIGTGGGAPTGTGGGAPGGTGGLGSGGTSGAGTGSTGDIWGGLKNPPIKSAGCGKPAALTKGKQTIMSGGVARDYIIDIPADYDPAKPYRLFYVSHGLNGRAEDTVNIFHYFGLLPQATAANDPAIFIAGQGLNGTWGQADHVFFDDVTAQVEAGLCIDTTRVFVTGMSMGGMYSYSLATDRQKSIRAAVGLAPTNYNIWLPNPKLTDPIAWMQTTGNVDTFCPWVADEAQKRGSKFIALEKATDNGCTIPATVPFWTSGNHICYDFAGCKPGYPVKACSFMGPHTDSARDPGTSVNWIAVESWKFFTQF